MTVRGSGVDMTLTPQVDVGSDEAWVLLVPHELQLVLPWDKEEDEDRYLLLLLKLQPSRDTASEVRESLLTSPRVSRSRCPLPLPPRPPWCGSCRCTCVGATATGSF